MDWHASGNLARRATTIGGETTTRIEFKDACRKPMRMSFEGDGAGTNLDIATAVSRWIYTGKGLLKTAWGWVTDTQYEADGQTRSIAYANGVTTAFTYSPQRRWLTGFETKQSNGTVLLAGQSTRDEAFVSSATGNPISRARLDHSADAEIEASIRLRPVYPTAPPQICEHLA